MRLIIDFNAVNGREIRLPVQYNHLIQAAVYNSLDEEFAGFLHDHGYESGGRSFKLFTFSRLTGEYRLTGAEIVFPAKVKLVISSPVDRFCQNLLNGLFGASEIRLGQALLQVESIKAESPKVEGDRLKLRLLSPAVAYSTLLKPEGKKYTCYFQPGEKEFTRVAGENLRKKYRAIYNREAPMGELEIRPVKQPKLHVMEFKGNVIKGYSGVLEMRGPGELLQVAVDAGIGSKNSMGFGCIEKCEE